MKEFYILIISYIKSPEGDLSFEKSFKFFYIYPQRYDII